MKRKAIAGSLVIIIGVLLLFHTLGLFAADAAFRILWSVALILAGLALIARMPGIAFVFVILAVVLGTFSIGEKFPDRQVYIQQVDLHPSFDRAEIDIAFGPGSFNLKGEEQSTLLTNYVQTLSGEPRVVRKMEGSKGMVKIESNGIVPQEWNVSVNPALPLDIKLEYGAADVRLDLTGLRVDNLKLMSGATNTRIKFATYPTQTVIDTGASDILLEFPRGVGVALIIEGGAVDLNINGFTQDGDKWVNEWYGGRSGIMVDIDAGATTVETRFYEAEG